MAQAALNPMFSSINGRIGGLVFYSYNNTTYCRAYVKPRNPNTKAQRAGRERFKQAMKAWQGLSYFDRASFSRRAKRLGMTGHNLFISRYMKTLPGSEPPSVTTAQRPLHAHRAQSLPFHHAGHSVCASKEVLDSKRVPGLLRSPPPDVIIIPAKSAHHVLSPLNPPKGDFKNL